MLQRSIEVHNESASVVIVRASWDCRIEGYNGTRCERLIEGDVRFQAGGNLRFHIHHNLIEGRIMVNDGAGYWEGYIGVGLTPVRLKCGGSFTLVTERPVSGAVLGHIEGRRAASEEQSEISSLTALRSSLSAQIRTHFDTPCCRRECRSRC